MCTTFTLIFTLPQLMHFGSEGRGRQGVGWNFGEMEDKKTTAGGSREAGKTRKSLQPYIIFCNRKRAKRREPPTSPLSHNP